MLSGGAILSKEVHEFIQVCLCPVMQAYGLTETCAGGTSQLPNQTENGVVGSVVPACEIRLVDWIEGGYRNTDTPNPRGEIYIGGDNVAMGYVEFNKGIDALIIGWIIFETVLEFDVDWPFNKAVFLVLIS